MSLWKENGLQPLMPHKAASFKDHPTHALHFILALRDLFVISWVAGAFLEDLGIVWISFCASVCTGHFASQMGTRLNKIEQVVCSATRTDHPQTDPQRESANRLIREGCSLGWKTWCVYVCEASCCIELVTPACLRCLRCLRFD